MFARLIIFYSYSNNKLFRACDNRKDREDAQPGAESKLARRFTRGSLQHAQPAFALPPSPLASHPNRNFWLCGATAVQ